jgi:hypothetical protein
MKRMLLCLLVSLIGIGCGGGQPTTSTPATSTAIGGSWTVTAAQNGQSGNSVFQVSLVDPSVCSVNDKQGDSFTVQGPKCSLADNFTGVGSVTLAGGQAMFPPQGVLLGATADPAPNGTQIDLLFAEEDQNGNGAVFNGNGTITSGTMSGTWVCNPNSPNCAGASGTFSGKKN